MAYFDSVHKSTKDFFKRNFSRDNKVELSAKADNGVKVTLEGGVLTQVSKDDKTGSERVVKSGTTSIKVDYKTSPVSLDKFEVGSDGTVKADLSLPEVAANTTASFKVEDGSRASSAKISGKFGVETVQQVGVQAGVKADFDAVQGDGSFSVLLKKSGVLVGANTAFTTPLAPAADAKKAKAGFNVTGYDFLLGYTTGAATFGVQTGKKVSNATAFVHAAVTPQVTVAAQAEAALAKGAKGIKASIGGSYKVDKDVTLYGSIDNKAVIKGAAALAVAPKASLTVFGELNALKIEEDGKHFFGTKLSLRA